MNYPYLPENFNQTKLTTTDPAYTAMIKCLWYNPHNRPTAGEIAAELVEAKDNLPDGFGDKKKWMELMDLRERIYLINLIDGLSCSSPTVLSRSHTNYTT